MELTWSLDYCLACDRQTSGGAYCSQSCRLADLETSNWSGSTSPTTPNFSPSGTSSDSNRGSGFYLSPAINFAAYKSPAASSTSTQTTAHTTAQTSYFSSTSSTQPSSDRTLTSSSSRSSLNSTQSEASQSSQLSEQIHSELRAYTNSFDTTRNRRRMTWS